jgi:hypothetical protein
LPIIASLRDHAALVRCCTPRRVVRRHHRTSRWKPFADRTGNVFRFDLDAGERGLLMNEGNETGATPGRADRFEALLARHGRPGPCLDDVTAESNG